MKLTSEIASLLSNSILLFTVYCWFELAKTSIDRDNWLELSVISSIFGLMAVYYLKNEYPKDDFVPGPILKEKSK